MTRKTVSSTKTAEVAESLEAREIETVSPKLRKTEQATAAPKHRKIGKTFGSARPPRIEKIEAKPRRLKATTVLVIQSVNDALTHGRIERARRNPRLRGHRVSHAFLVELSEYERSLDIEVMMMHVHERSIDGDELFHRLEGQISELRPSFLVVHAGFVFQATPEVVLGVLHRLKVTFSRMRFGLESR